MTATQADSDDSKISRRGVMRVTAFGIGSTATVAGGSKMGLSPVGSANAIPPLAIVGGAIAAGAAATYITEKVEISYVGDSNEEYDSANADATHSQIRENALNAKQADTAVLGNMSNLLDSASNFVIAQAKKAAIDAMNAGDTESEANTKMVAEIDGFFATQQENLLAHSEAQFSKFLSWIEQANNTTNLSSNQVFSVDNSDGGGQIYQGNTTTVSVPLVSGDSYSLTVYEFQPSSTSVYMDNNMQNSDIASTATMSVSAVDSGSSSVVLDGTRYVDLFAKIESEHSSIKSEMETWLTNVYPAYESGDVSSSDLISPTDLVGDSQTQDGYSFAGASLASLGLKSSDYALEIELVETGETVEGSIYHSDDSITSLQKDVEYDPATDIAGTVYLAYNNTDEDKGELIGLEEPFIIRAITDGEGNTYNAANYESKNQQTYSEDISEIQKELEQIREVRESLEEQRDAAALDDTTAGGAGAGFFSGDGPSLGVVAGILGAIGLVYSFTQGDA